jgi:type IV secretion system protein TrbG
MTQKQSKYFYLSQHDLVVGSVILSAIILAGCTSRLKPPEISYDDAAPAVQTIDPPAPIKVVELPKPLALPGQLKPMSKSQASPEPREPTARIASANVAACVQPAHDAFINAMQVYPFTQGALFQVYAAVSQITDIAPQPGEQLVGSGPVAAGDTVRWIIGDTESGVGQTRQVHILVKPTRADLATNLVINTNFRTYHMELRSTVGTYMASVTWQYPQDQLIALKRQSAEAEAAKPVATDVDLSKINFRYAIEGDRAPWRPLRAYDDGRQVFIEFPRGIGQGEMPPLFVVGPEGDTSELVNYRVRGTYMIVDRLFAAAELRLGAGKAHTRVRIIRTTENRATADGLAGLPREYSAIPKLGPPLPGDLGRPILNAQNRGQTIPSPAIGAVEPGPSAEEQRRQQELETAHGQALCHYANACGT